MSSENKMGVMPINKLILSMSIPSDAVHADPGPL